MLTWSSVDVIAENCDRRKEVIISLSDELGYFIDKQADSYAAQKCARSDRPAISQGQRKQNSHEKEQPAPQRMGNM